MPKEMRPHGKGGLAGWIRTTRMSCIGRVPEERRDEYIARLVDRYLRHHPPGVDGTMKVRMVRLEKDCQQGTPQGGVASPLLANIYMRRFLLIWEKWEFPRKLQAQVVNYADDFVILCRKPALEAREKAEEIIGALKLQLNREKTRVVNVWREPFDFLGYTFGLCYQAGKKGTYLRAKPSKKRILRLYGKIREHLHPGNTAPFWVVVDALNRSLVGWAEYFSYGTLSRVYRSVDYFARERLRWWLCRRHRVGGRGTRQFPDDMLYRKYGLICLSNILSARRSNA